jgi:CarD family transcriptional regulator
MSLLSDGAVDQHPNWKGRFKENSDKMRTGSLYEVAVVLKGLTALSKKKTLSFREKRMLDRAKFLLVSEIAEAEGKPHSAIEDRVEKALTKGGMPEPKVMVAKKPVQKPVAAKRRAANA